METFLSHAVFKRPKLVTNEAEKNRHCCISKAAGNNAPETAQTWQGIFSPFDLGIFLGPEV